MPRKKTNVEPPLQPVVETPEGVGHTLPEGPVIRPKGELSANQTPAEAQTRDWGDPYRRIFICREKGFEMGENRRFKQRVFKFDHKPTDEVLAKLKEAGLVYRAGEKSWTITANPDTRKLTDDLARELAGQSVQMAR